MAASLHLSISNEASGDHTLSPSLFITALELLAISVRNNNQITGIARIDGNELKLVTFADDMTSFEIIIMDL